MTVLRYTSTHEWLKDDGNGEFLIGITDHAQQLLGDMVFVELPDEGDAVKAGDELGVVESVKAASDYYTPISGIVVAVNQSVNDHPSLVNQDPYGSGWLVRIRASQPDEVSQLLTEEQYQKEISEDH